MTELPLSGLRVLDFSTLLPGPLAGLLLAEAGADVIKIERPGGEDGRRMKPNWGDVAATFAFLNGGKRSVAIDLKQAGARERLLPLIESADILIEQFRPGVMARLGLGYEELCVLNPRLIYCSITGYGQDGPLAGRAGHDLNYQGEAGILALNTGAPERPQVPPVLAADIAGGSYPAVMNILLALRQREHTGRGLHLDIAMTDNLFAFAFRALAGGWAGGDWPRSGTGLLTGGSPRYQLYPTADGALLAVAALEDRFWDTFCEAMELPDDLRLADAPPDRVIDAIRTLVSCEPAAHWADLFERVDCCCSIVRSLAEAVTSPHFQARGLFDYSLRQGDLEGLGALPVPISRELRRPSGEVRDVAPLGAHNEELLGKS
ncbi:MAG: CoA transferase [Hyphomicrobiales bacterium]|nr:CoA transferase [Hyphomicrobiales bacterium]